MAPTDADKKKKRRKDPSQGTEPRFSQGTYLTKIHKAQHGTSMTISQAAVKELDRVVEHVIDALTHASGEVLAYSKSQTLNTRVIKSAASAVLTGALKRRAIERAEASVTAFQAASGKAVAAVAAA